MITREAGALCASGAITYANVAQVCESGKQQFFGDPVRIDFSGVTEVDSSALSLLFEWQREASRRKISLSIENLPASLVSLAALYGVTELITPGK